MKCLKILHRSIFLLVLVAWPASVSAAVQITEIMYDLDGADQGFEWIEVTNTGTEPVDIGDWRFFEANTNHKLVLASGASTVLMPGASAVVADRPENFITHWPNVAQVFDSAFSLSNTGETLALKNAALAVVDQVAYSAEGGAAGDGGSLHRRGDTLVPGLPNPGVYPGELRTVPAKQSAPASTRAATTRATSATTKVSEPATALPTQTTQLAAAGGAQNSFSLLPYLAGLGGIILIGIAGTVLARKEAQNQETPSLADEFEIEEG